MRFFEGSLLPLLLSRALLTSGLSVAASGFLRHESVLAVLANDVSKIRRNAHCVRDALICGRAGRDLHGGKSREETPMPPCPRNEAPDDTGVPEPYSRQTLVITLTHTHGKRARVMLP